MSLNKVILIGRLGRDPEVRYMPNGEAVCNFSVATSETWNDRNGQRVERTEWHNITMYRRLAEIAGQYLKKGSQVYLEGRIQSRKYQGKDGIERTAYDIIANEMKMLGGRLGDMEPAGTVHSYPLMGVHASKFYATRAALIGDAAVGMHPVTAHGYNLGLESTDILAKLILKAEKKGRDIGSHKLLEKYNIEHQLHTRPLYHGTNFVVKLFTNETPPAKFLRNTVLRLSNHLPPVTKLITKQLTG